MVVMYEIVMVDYTVSGECGRGRASGEKGRRVEGGKGEERSEYKEREEKNWGRERKVGQERAKQIDIWTEWKREISNNRLF
jgi:hypothetical protein